MINQERISKLKITFLSKEEQIVIANFLDKNLNF